MCVFRDLYYDLLCSLLSRFIVQDGGSLDQVLKEAKRIPEEILGKVSIAVSVWLSCMYIIIVCDITLLASI